MKRERLDSRSEQRRLSSGDTGEMAEDLANDAYGYNGFISAPWYDGKRESSGAVIEVKSALSRLDSGEPGRFRLWRKQHEQLVEKDRDGSAWYVFVLFDLSTNPPVARMTRREPASIGRSVAARGGFGPSGHAERGEQHKLPINAIFPEVQNGE